MQHWWRKLWTDGYCKAFGATDVSTEDSPLPFGIGMERYANPVTLTLTSRLSPREGHKRVLGLWVNNRNLRRPVKAVVRATSTQLGC